MTTLLKKSLVESMMARNPTNTAAHADRAAPNLTGAKARAFRKATMKLCPCRLCALALNPPMTFEEAALFGFDAIAAESAGVFRPMNSNPAFAGPTMTAPEYLATLKEAA
jgi:hypothetical protein